MCVNEYDHNTQKAMDKAKHSVTSIVKKLVKKDYRLLGARSCQKSLRRK